MINSSSFANNISLSLIRKIELLADENDGVLWIQNADYNEQLYVSSNYSTLWNREAISLYRNADAWSATLDISDAETYMSELRHNRILINPEYTTIYCIKLPDGRKRWFQDRSLRLPLARQTCIIIGCALWLQEKDSISQNQNHISDKLDYLITQFYALLTMQSSASSEMELCDTSLLSTLTKREKQIYNLLLHGHTLSQIAEIVYLSTRTVEGYLIKLKQKLTCDSKSELIVKAIENGWLQVNIK